MNYNQICAILEDKLDLSESLLPLNVEKEQRNDPDIVEVNTLILNKVKPETMCSTYDLKKYHKHNSRLTLEHGLLYRKFFDHTGKNYHEQLVVPKHLRTELLYRIHNSKMKGHLGIQKKTEREFRRKYYFLGFVDFLVRYINNCLTCEQDLTAEHCTITVAGMTTYLIYRAKWRHISGIQKNYSWNLSINIKNFMIEKHQPRHWNTWILCHAESKIV